MIRKIAALAFWAVCVPASAGWYGESNYSDCLQQNLKDAQDPPTVAAVKQACRNKFPEKPQTNPPAPDDCQIPPGENGYGSYHHCKPKKIEESNSAPGQ